VTDADTDDRNVPCLNVEAIVDMSKVARTGSGRASNLCCATNGKDWEARIMAIERVPNSQ